MITLVTGAGSSIDIDKTSFFSGIELIEGIIDLTANINDFTNQTCNYLRFKGENNPMEIIEEFNEDLKYYFKIKNSSESGYSESEENKIKRGSIDEFLSEIMVFPEYSGKTRDYFVDIGKYAIFYKVMEMENKFFGRYPAGVTTNNWILDFKELLDINKDVIIITFNYDRLIEHILGKEYECRVLHVYGTVSLSNWPFGCIPGGIGSNKSANEIEYRNLGDFKIVNDRVREPKTSGIIGIERIAQRLQQLNFVMGFGYDFYNVRNLGLLNNSNRTVYTNIFPTDDKAKGFMQRRGKTIEVRKMIPDAHFTYNDCKQLVEFIKTFK
ncbi:MAG: hypothetical protein IPL22_09345 [Bacteroidetes bacterium]|nr:hypothetical protein [Bacteroidota bacterium]